MTNTDALKVLREALESCRDLASHDNNGVAFDIADKALAATEVAAIQTQGEARPELTVWEGAMPESNGKSNFTAVLHRKDSKGFDLFTDGFQFERSEYPDRVRYEADFMRWLIGERAKKPELWDEGYDMDKHSGYVKPLQDAKVEQVQRTPTNDQIASVMLQHGTPEQQHEALAYCGIAPAAPVQVEASELPKLPKPDIALHDDGYYTWPQKPHAASYAGWKGHAHTDASMIAYGQLCRDAERVSAAQWKALYDGAMQVIESSKAREARTDRLGITPPAITEPAPAMQSDAEILAIIDAAQVEWGKGNVDGGLRLHVVKTALKQLIARPRAAPVDLKDTLSAVLWLYHRLPRGYERQSHIERVIRILATQTGDDGDLLVSEIRRYK